MPVPTKISILIAMAVLVIANGQSHEDDDCSLDDGTPGVCKKIRNCPGVAEMITKRIYPKLCSFHHKEAIVCCVPTVTSEPQRVDTQLNPIATYGQKAKLMCNRYASAVYTEITIESALIPEKYNRSECVSPDEELITGGIEALPKEFPHMVALGYGDLNNIEWNCGGSLISERFILTAAHCISSKFTGDVKWARLGDLNLKSMDDDAQPVTLAVVERLKHEGYRPPGHYNDIALLKMERDVTFNGFIRPACLHTQAGDPPGLGTATGWGLVNHYEEKGSDDLMKVDLLFQNVDRCNTSYKSLIKIGNSLRNGILEESMICAGDPNGKKDTCPGDSGGPLQIRLMEPNCMYSIVGVTSFGPRGCGVAATPAVYTRVSYFVPWIESHVWP